MLLTVVFNVLQVGATSIDIVQTTHTGGRKTILGFGATSILYSPVDAYFRNKPGIPPAATFNYSPIISLMGDTVTFDASSSFDPDNSEATGRGISNYLWDFGDGFQTIGGPVQQHIFTAPPNIPILGNFSVTLVVTDSDNNLPMRQIIVVRVSPPPVHDVAVSLTLSKITAIPGDTLTVQVALIDRGNQAENVDFNVTYDYKGSIIISRETGLGPGPPLFGWVRLFNYTLATGGLPDGTYDVTARAVLVDRTTGAVIPDLYPENNEASVELTLFALDRTAPLWPGGTKLSPSNVGPNSVPGHTAKPFQGDQDLVQGQRCGDTRTQPSKKSGGQQGPSAQQGRTPTAIGHRRPKRPRHPVNALPRRLQGRHACPTPIPARQRRSTS